MEARQYGAWLRAPLFNPIRKSTVVIPSFYKQKKENLHPTTTGGPAPTSTLQNPPVSQTAPAAQTQKVTTKSSPPIITNPILNNDSKIFEDFPSGFEGQNFKKGNFTQQLQEIDEELAKFDDMEGIDINTESLPNQDSTTLLSPVSSEIHVPQIPILPANGLFSSHNLESTSVISLLRDISNSQATHK